MCVCGCLVRPLEACILYCLLIVLSWRHTGHRAGSPKCIKLAKQKYKRPLKRTRMTERTPANRGARMTQFALLNPTFKFHAPQTNVKRIQSTSMLTKELLDQLLPVCILFQHMVESIDHAARRNICGEKNSLDSTIPFLNLNWNTRFDTELIGKICVSIQQEGLDFLLYTKKTIAIACIIRKLDDSFTHIINYPHHLFLPFFPPQTKLFTLPIKFQKRELH